MATQLFLRDEASDLGGAGQKNLSTVRGSSSVNAITTTTASGTNITVTATAGGQALTWFSEPLPAQSLSGTVTVNIRGRESGTAVNAGAGILIERTNSAGTVQSTILSDRTVPASITEYTTTDAAKTSSGLTITTTTFSANDRIKVTLKVRNVGTMAAGTVTNTYDGDTVGAAGETYVTFSANLATIQKASAPLVVRANLIVDFPTVAPTIVSATDLADGIGARSFTAITTQANDYIVVEAATDHNQEYWSDVVPTATGLTFTTVNDTGVLNPNARSRVYQWSALDTTGGSRTITLTPNAADLHVRARATVVRGSQGPGAAANDQNSQTVSLARHRNSAMFMTVGDYNATDVSAVTWTPGGTTTVSETVAGFVSYAFALWSNSGAPGVPAAHGINTPAVGNPSAAVMEMTGTYLSPVNGTAAFTVQATMAVAASITVNSAAAFTSNVNLSATGTRVQFGTAGFTIQAGLSGAGIVSKLGTAAFTIQAGLTASAGLTRLGIAALTVQAGLNATAVDTVFGTSGQSAQSTLTSTGSNTVLPISAMSIQSGLSVIGIVSKLGAATFSANTDLAISTSGAWFGTSALTADTQLNASAILTRLAVAPLTIQATQSVTAIAIKLPTAPLTIQATLAASATLARLATAPLTIQAVQTTTSIVTVFGAPSMSIVSTLNAVGTVTGDNPQAAFSIQSNLSAFGTITRFGTSSLSSTTTLNGTAFAATFANGSLSQQSALGATALDSVPSGSIAFNSQSTLTASGSIGALPVSASLSVQSGLNVSGLVTKLGSVAFTIQANLTGAGKATTFAVAALTNTVTMNPIGVVGKLGTAGFTVQATLTASGYIATIYFGSAAFSVQSDLEVDAHATPPWVFTLIEFSSTSIIDPKSGDGTIVSGYDVAQSKVDSKESMSYVSTIEGG
jgi:hypothetical protein